MNPVIFLFIVGFQISLLFRLLFVFVFVVDFLNKFTNFQMQALMALPAPDFNLCLFLIPERAVVTCKIFKHLNSIVGCNNIFLHDYFVVKGFT